MNRMLVTFLLLLVFGSANAGTGRDGGWWPHLSLAEKVMYINGFLDGQTFAHTRFNMNIFEALQDPKTGKYDPSRNPGIIALQTVSQDEFKSGFNGVSPEQIIKGLDKVYADYRNLRIEVADALDVVVKSISGSTDLQYESVLEFYRKRAN
jgi:hypothetical protein